MKLRLSALALGTTLLVGCASSGTDQQGRSDPLEGFNRTMYNFNFNVLDPYIVRPVAVAWRDYVPQPARNGLSIRTSWMGTLYFVVYVWCTEPANATRLPRRVRRPANKTKTPPVAAFSPFPAL